MTRIEVIKNVLGIAQRHATEDDSSVLSLVAESGYFQAFNDVSEQDLYEEILAHPNLIKEWIGFSEDKRTTGWYLREETDGTLKLGYIPEKGERVEVPARYFKDRASAVATFIKLEIEGVRQRHPTAG
jgi:hypothetical protein